MTGCRSERRYGIEPSTGFSRRVDVNLDRANQYLEEIRKPASWYGRHGLLAVSKEWCLGEHRKMSKHSFEVAEPEPPPRSQST